MGRDVKNDIGEGEYLNHRLDTFKGHKSILRVTQSSALYSLKKIMSNKNKKMSSFKSN